MIFKSVEYCFKEYVRYVYVGVNIKKIERNNVPCIKMYFVIKMN